MRTGIFVPSFPNSSRSETCLIISGCNLGWTRVFSTPLSHQPRVHLPPTSILWEKEPASLSVHQVWFGLYLVGILPAEVACQNTAEYWEHFLCSSSSQLQISSPACPVNAGENPSLSQFPRVSLTDWVSKASKWSFYHKGLCFFWGKVDFSSLPQVLSQAHLTLYSWPHFVASHRAGRRTSSTTSTQSVYLSLFQTKSGTWPILQC